MPVYGTSHHQIVRAGHARLSLNQGRLVPALRQRHSGINRGPHHFLPPQPQSRRTGHSSRCNAIDARTRQAALCYKSRVHRRNRGQRNKFTECPACGNPAGKKHEVSRDLSIDDAYSRHREGGTYKNVYGEKRFRIVEVALEGIRQRFCEPRGRVVSSSGKANQSNSLAGRSFQSGKRTGDRDLLFGAEQMEPEDRFGHDVTRERLFMSAPVPPRRIIANETPARDRPAPRNKAARHPIVRFCVVRCAHEHSRLTGQYRRGRSSSGTGSSWRSRCTLPRRGTGSTTTSASDRIGP